MAYVPELAGEPWHKRHTVRLRDLEYFLASHASWGMTVMYGTEPITARELYEAARSDGKDFQLIDSVSNPDADGRSADPADDDEPPWPSPAPAREVYSDPTCIFSYCPYDGRCQQIGCAHPTRRQA